MSNLLDVLSLGLEASSILSDLKLVWNDLNKINHLFGTKVDLNTFISCIGAIDNSFEAFLSVSSQQFSHCLDTFDPSTEVVRSKRSSWIGYLMGTGQQVDAIESSLGETIQSYNENFGQIQQLDGLLVIKYKKLISKLKNLNDHENLLRDLILSTQI